MSRNKLTKHLLVSAENDDFHTTLHILLSTHPSQIYLNKRTSSGDYLITLAAYAACERTTTEIKTRINAVKCLIFILDRDFTAVNQVAEDGGSALHCALVAASCFEEFDGDNEEEEDCDCHSEESNEDDFDDDDFDKEESHEKIDVDYLRELKSKAKQEHSLMDLFHPELMDLSSDEIVLMTILLLLSNESDVNLPIANVNNLSSGNFEEDDGHEIELTFSRESIIEQWTPLMLGLQMIILSTKEVDESNQNRFLSFSILIVHLLLEADADPFYMMAGNAATTGKNWNCFHVLNSAYLHLGFTKMDTQVMENITKLQNTSMELLKTYFHQCIYKKVEDLGHYDTIYDCMDSILLKKAKERHLTSIQLFVSAMIRNDVNSATSTIKELYESQDQKKTIEKWRSLKFSSIFPLLHSVWDSDEHFSMTVMDAAAYFNSADSIRFLINNDPMTLSEKELKNCLKFAITNHALRCDYDGQIRGKLKTTLQILLEEKDEISSRKKQRVLDMLLIECCKQTQWAQNSTMDILLQLRADPNIASIANNIKDALTPLHLIAGNHRGDDGVIKLELLLGQERSGLAVSEKGKTFKSANLFALTSESNRLPLQIALEKKNYRVAKHLFEAMDIEVHENTMQWDIQQAYLLGEAAIECTSLDLFQSATDIMKRLMTAEDFGSSSRAIGKLLLLAFDERSGIGRKLMSIGDKELHYTLCQIIHTVSDIHEQHQELSLYSWYQDDVSGHTPLHHLLRNDRGPYLRKLFLHPICTLLSRDDDRRNTTKSTNSVSLPCDQKFGFYTPLHLACALGCEDSVRTLLQFNADTKALSDDTKRPIEMIPKQTNFCSDIMTLLA